MVHSISSIVSALISSLLLLHHPKSLPAPVTISNEKSNQLQPRQKLVELAFLISFILLYPKSTGCLSCNKLIPNLSTPLFQAMHVEQQPLVPITIYGPICSTRSIIPSHKIGGYNLVQQWEQMPLESLSSNQAHTLSALLIFLFQ